MIGAQFSIEDRFYSRNLFSAKFILDSMNFLTEDPFFTLLVLKDGRRFEKICPTAPIHLAQPLFTLEYKMMWTWTDIWIFIEVKYYAEKNVFFL